MKILDKIKGFGEKVNFADENNICVGYDTQQDCCEDAGWFISRTEESDAYVDGHEERDDFKDDVSGFVFDKSYFKEVDASDCDDGGMVRFRLTNGNEELFLHLYNNHNGYYGHGFEFMDDNNIIKDGCL